MYFNSETFFTVHFSRLASDIAHTNCITHIICVFPCHSKIVMVFNKYILVISENMKVFKDIFSSVLSNK